MRLPAGRYQADDPRRGDQADEKAAGGLQQIGQPAALGEDGQPQKTQRHIYRLTGRAIGRPQQAAGHGGAEELQRDGGVAQRDADEGAGGGERRKQRGAGDEAGIHGGVSFRVFSIVLRRRTAVQ